MRENKAQNDENGAQGSGNFTMRTNKLKSSGLQWGAGSVRWVFTSLSMATCKVAGRMK
jgi:hypothetical protein